MGEKELIPAKTSDQKFMGTCIIQWFLIDKKTFFSQGLIESIKSGKYSTSENLYLHVRREEELKDPYTLYSG